MSELPEGWAECNLSDLASYVTSGSRDWSQYYADEGALFVRTQDINKNRLGDLSSVARVSLPDRVEGKRTLIQLGDVLITITGANVGRCAVVSDPLPEAYVSQSVALVRLADSALCTYVQRHLTAPDAALGKTWLEQSAYGLGRPVLSLDDVRETPIRLAPLAEQRRVVAKLDALTASTARARADLDRIPALTARYKRAVLSSAFGGELTKFWRVECGEVEFAPDEIDALQRRRLTYESGRRGSRLRDMPELHLPGEASDLPASWGAGCVADVADLRVGYAFKSAWFTDCGVPVIRGANVGVGAIERGALKHLTPERASEFASYRLAEGDIVLAMDRPVISAGLKIAKVTAAEAGALLVQRVASPVLTPLVDENFMWWLFHSPHYLGQIERHATGSDLPHVSGNDILTTFLPLPPLPEQREIARRIDAAFSEIDRVTAEAASACRLLDRLDQAVLAKAFRGELVPQDPLDEPASVLLDRIRAERAAAPKAKRARAARAAA